MNLLIQVNSLINLHTQSILDWKHNGIHFVYEHFLGLVEKNHAYNYQLWHAEDRARRDDKDYEFVYRAKREIDQFNQWRNNQMEAMDDFLYNLLSPESNDSCPVHSETPGMMIDRLSILALKIYHMGLQTQRHDVDESHRQTCQLKLDTLTKQQNQLASCLEALFHEIQLKKRTFKIYHQFKMYNDPTLNPELYQKVKS